MRFGGKAILLGAGLAASLLVAACDEAEQNRVLRYEKGTYLGQVDRPLTADQVSKLRNRARRQPGG